MSRGVLPLARRYLFEGIDPELPVKCADECVPCPTCGEAWCEECEMHYTDCAHPGPASEFEQVPAEPSG